MRIVTRGNLLTHLLFHGIITLDSTDEPKLILNKEAFLRKVKTQIILLISRII